jgi:hypothetical protein
VKQAEADRLRQIAVVFQRVDRVLDIVDYVRRQAIALDFDIGIRVVIGFGAVDESDTGFLRNLIQRTDVYRR